MNKTWKIFEYGYLVIAIVFIVETVLHWNIDREKKAYLMLLFAVVAIFMYFFKRRFRKRIQNRNK